MFTGVLKKNSLTFVVLFKMVYLDTHRKEVLETFKIKNSVTQVQMWRNTLKTLNDHTNINMHTDSPLNHLANKLDNLVVRIITPDWCHDLTLNSLSIRHHHIILAESAITKRYA